jgi:matrixin
VRSNGRPLGRAGTAALFLLLLGFAGCGGRRSSGPTTPLVTPSSEEAPPETVAAGTLLRFVSGETDEDVSGATVTVQGRVYTSDALGQVTLGEAVMAGEMLEVTAGPFLDRHTVLRADGESRFSLWPRQSPTGLDEAYTATLVYTDSSQTTAFSGTFPLSRLPVGTTRVGIVPSPEIRADPDALAAHEQALAILSAATGGRIAYVLDAERSGVSFDTRIDPRDKDCAPRIRAFTQVSGHGGEIAGGRVVFCSPEVARSVTVTHELGHTFGLQHSSDPDEIMYAFYVAGRSQDFSPREALAMSLMLQRRPGNRYPDRDPETGAAGPRTHTIICR